MNISITDELIIIDGKRFIPEPKEYHTTLIEAFNEFHGAKEYSGIVAEIQKWYYGEVRQSAWCATALSYFAAEIGKLAAIGGKADNVYTMMIQCKAAAGRGYGKFYDKASIPDIKKNDILFFLWSGTKMDAGSNKHVGIAEYDSASSDQFVFCLGGNQKDKICTLQYAKSKLYAVYRIGG